MRVFGDCTSLSNLDISRFNTENVTTMEQMFYNCRSLADLNVSSFNTSEVQTMYGMFSNCSSLTELDVTGFDVSNVFSFEEMFYNCTNLERLDVSGFKLYPYANYDFERMFYGCSKIESLDLRYFNTLNSISNESMFENMTSLKSIMLPETFVFAGTDANKKPAYLIVAHGSTASTPRWKRVYDLTTMQEVNDNTSYSGVELTAA